MVWEGGGLQAPSLRQSRGKKMFQQDSIWAASLEHHANEIQWHTAMGLIAAVLGSWALRRPWAMVRWDLERWAVMTRIFSHPGHQLEQQDHRISEAQPRDSLIWKVPAMGMDGGVWVTSGPLELKTPTQQAKDATLQRTLAKCFCKTNDSLVYVHKILEWRRWCSSASKAVLNPTSQ